MPTPPPPRVEPLDPVSVIGLLADGDRLRVVAALVLGARTAEDVKDSAGLGARATTRALERLAAGGLVERDVDGRLRVASERLQDAARAAGRARAELEKPEDFGDVPAAAAAVLRNFVRDGRLVSIPASRGKRRAVLDWLATRFDPGKVYPERDVNFMLGLVHADVAALRRYLVDEGFLERREGFYWRAGGTFEVD